MREPVLETSRLLLRPFGAADQPALLDILGDEEANTFLPWFPLRSLPEVRAFYKTRLCSGQSRWFAVCPKEAGVPVGYVSLDGGEGHDLGYGLKKAWWGKGLAVEAAGAVLQQLRREGLPFVTATHDVENPHSGRVMEKLGMTYRYSYEEQWQPKNRRVLFRLYQMELDGREHPTYSHYWDTAQVRFQEKGL